MPISNSPHPVSVSSNGGCSTRRTGSLKLGCSWNVTWNKTAATQVVTVFCDCRNHLLLAVQESQRPGRLGVWHLGRAPAEIRIQFCGSGSTLLLLVEVVAIRAQGALMLQYLLIEGLAVA